MTTDETYTCTERFVFGVTDPAALRATTQEESDLMVIAFAIEPSAVFDTRASEAEKAAQNKLLATAKRVRDALIRYHRINSP